MQKSEPASPRWPFRVVPDTNVFISAVLPDASDRDVANGFRKPLGVEFLERAFYEEFLLLLSTGTYFELIEKLEELCVPQGLILELAQRLHDVAEAVTPTSSAPICADPDDDKFVHTAVAGRATHLVSHDRHLKSLDTSAFEFRVVVIVSFFRELRAEMKRRLRG